jgi:hypothetical protein
MNIPINKRQTDRLFPHVQQQFLYGSRLFKVHTKESDYDIVMLYQYDDVFEENYYLPNIHSFQYTDIEKNQDIIFMTYEQFWKSFYDADGTLYADIVLFSKWFSNDEALQMCRSYKIIKGYCGTAKRDLTSSGCTDKIIKRSAKNLYIAYCLLNNIFPEIKQIKYIYKQNFDVKYLLQQEIDLRIKANEMFNENKLSNYSTPTTEDDLLNIMLHGNNLKEYIFKK